MATRTRTGFQARVRRGGQLLTKHFAASKHGGIHGARRAAAAYEHAVKTRRRRLAPLDDYMRDALRILREAKRSLE